MSAKKEISAATRMRQLLIRLWMEQLTLAEFAVCCFIFERTYPFKKTETAISIDQFLHGFSGRNGFRQGSLPIGLGRTQLMAVLSGLEAKGAIFRHRVPGRKTVYGLNPHWQDEWEGRDESCPQPSVDNCLPACGTRSVGRTGGVRTPEHRTSEPDIRNEQVIVDGAAPSAAALPQHQPKPKVSRSRRAKHRRAHPSRVGS